MRRRAFLAGVTTAVGAVAGCRGSEETGETSRASTGRGATGPATPAPTSTERPTDGGADGSTATRTPTETRPPASLPRLTFTFSNPWAGTYLIRVEPDGTTVHEWSCRTGETVRERGELTPAERDRLRSLLAAAEPSAWRDYYRCDRPCPTDLPGYGLVLERGGRTYETGYYLPARTPPDALVDLTTFFRESEMPDVSVVDQCRSPDDPTTDPTAAADTTSTED